jgi:pyruvate/2-oxoglutarate dehydrogenase complex dihydrolipoamide dehydrogenase (E3) component
MVREGKPDKVIIATGARQIVPDIPGIDDPKVVQAEDVLRGRADTGMIVLVIGAGMTGTETAAHLAVQCKESVGLVSRRPYIGKGMEGGMRDDLTDCLNKFFVKIITDTALVAVTPEGAKLKSGDKEYIYPCDTIVLGIGAESYKPLEEELKGICDTVVIGDALKARKAIQATREGFVAGINA